MLVPAYRPGPAAPPDPRRPAHRPGPAGRLVVVDDGSGPAYAPVFAAARALGRRGGHPAGQPRQGRRPQGRLRARRRGRARALAVVCADADGQHALDDIVADRGAAGRRPGGTTARAGHPRPSTATCRCAAASATTSPAGSSPPPPGSRLSDTQTGLRGLPAGLLGWACDVPGERYEYELQVLLRAGRGGRRARPGADRHDLPRRQQLVALPAGRRLGADLPAAARLPRLVAGGLHDRHRRAARAPGAHRRPARSRSSVPASPAPASTSSSTAASSSTPDRRCRTGAPPVATPSSPRRSWPQLPAAEWPHRARPRPAPGQGADRARAGVDQLRGPAALRLHGPHATVSQEAHKIAHLPDRCARPPSTPTSR